MNRLSPEQRQWISDFHFPRPTEALELPTTPELQQVFHGRNLAVKLELAIKIAKELTESGDAGKKLLESADDLADTIAKSILISPAPTHRGIQLQLQDIQYQDPDTAFLMQEQLRRTQKNLTQS